MISKNLSFSFNHKDQRDKLYEVMTSQDIKNSFDSRAEDIRAYIYTIIDELKSSTGTQNIGHKGFDLNVKLENIDTLTSNFDKEITAAREGKTTLLLNLTDIRSILNKKAEATHTHTKANISDFTHTHTKSEISDFPSIPPAYTLPAATASSLGGIKVGSGLSVDGAGLLSASYSYTLPAATASILGGVKIGSGINVNAGVISLASHTHTKANISDYADYSLPIASASILGGVKVGANLTIDSNGVLNAVAVGGGDTYVLPTASASVLGGVKVGSGLSIDGAGLLSATYSYSLPTASASVLGGVKIGTGINIAAGVISLATHTHTKANISDFSHTHTKSEISDFPTIPPAYTLPTATASVLGGVKVGAGLSINAGVLSANKTNFDDLQNVPIYTLTLSKTDSSLPIAVRQANIDTIKAYIADTRKNKIVIGSLYNTSTEFRIEDLYMCSNSYYSQEEDLASFQFARITANPTSLISDAFDLTYTITPQTYVTTHKLFNMPLNSYKKAWTGTQAQYDSVVTKSDDTVYYITG